MNGFYVVFMIGLFFERALHAVFSTLMSVNEPLVGISAACSARWFSHVR